MSQFGIKLHQFLSFSPWFSKVLPTGDPVRKLFMPGCSLSASRPQQALQAYQHLQSIYDEPVGLLLTCCGKPTKYLKQPRLYKKRFHHLENKITQSGADEIITACQNCLQVLRQGNPQFKVSSLWTCLAEQGLPETSKFISQTPFTCHVQDSCATRQYPEVQQSARHLMTRLGVKYVEVDDAKGQILCCGQGELMGSSVSDPASFLRKRASRFDKHPVMTYCAGCQEAVHRGDSLRIICWTSSFPKKLATRSQSLSRRRYLLNGKTVVCLPQKQSL